MDQLEVKVCARARRVRAWRVKRLLRRKGYAIKVIVDVTEDGEPISRLPNADGRGTAPQVFVDGRMVGGLDNRSETAQCLRSERVARERK